MTNKALGQLVRDGNGIDDRKRAEDRTRNEKSPREEIVRSSMFEESSAFGCATDVLVRSRSSADRLYRSDPG